MRSARKLPCEALPARLSRERGPAGGRGGDGGAKDITRRRATHSFSFVFSVLIFSLKFMYSALFSRVHAWYFNIYDILRYFTRQARMNPTNCSVFPRHLPETRCRLPETIYPRPDSCFSTLFSPTRIEFLKTDLCVLRSIRVSEQSGTAIGMQTTRENIYRFLLRSIRVSIFESTAMN